MTTITEIKAPQAPYTTRIAGAGGMLEEMQMLFTIYEAGMTAQQLHEKALQGFMLAMSESAIKRAVKAFSVRFMVGDTASHLKALLYKISLGEFKSLMLLHTAISDSLFCDFLSDCLWVLGNEKAYEYVTLSDAQNFVEDAVHEGKTTTPWAASTIKSIASSALAICADYGVLRSPAGARRFFDNAHYSKSTDTALYLAYYLHLSGLSDNQVVSHKLWGAMGFDSGDVRYAINSLCRGGYLINQTAGGVCRISWKYTCMLEVVGELIARHDAL